MQSKRECANRRVGEAGSKRGAVVFCVTWSYVEWMRVSAYVDESHDYIVIYSNATPVESHARVLLPSHQVQDPKDWGYNLVAQRLKQFRNNDRHDQRGDNYCNENFVCCS